MDYEVFYSEYAALSRQLKNNIADQQKILRRIDGYIEKGDFRGAKKELPGMIESAAKSAEGAADLNSRISSADMAGFLASGEFIAQLKTMCGRFGMTLKGDGSSYDLFPYRLKIDPHNADLLINGKKAEGLRPKFLASELAKARAKLFAIPFNPARFATELAAAYDVAVLAESRNKEKPIACDADVFLLTLYKYLTPMGRFRRDYDARSYALDLARLYDFEPKETADGRRFQFGPSRDNNRAIRVLDAGGNEQFLATIRFFRER